MLEADRLSHAGDSCGVPAADAFSEIQAIEPATEAALAQAKSRRFMIKDSRRFTMYALLPFIRRCCIPLHSAPG